MAALRIRAGWLAVTLLEALLFPIPLKADWIWMEGEAATKSSAHRHPWYDGQVKKDLLSGGDFLSHFEEKAAAEAEYRVQVRKAGEYEFWVRANPVLARLSYRLNGGERVVIDPDKGRTGDVNIASDGKPDLRFVAWSHVGKVSLKKGANVVSFRMDSANSNHGAIDCFVFADEPFRPMGTLKPDKIAAATKAEEEKDKGWFAFAPPPDPYRSTSGIDLRSLNEKNAGDGGFISVKGSEFVHSKTGEPIRFWAVNGPPGKDREALRADAKALAKRGVNLVRVHGGYFNADGEVDPAKVKHAIEVVEAMKSEGIYTHFSIYFPLWFQPKAGHPWLAGYDGSKHPFAALYFNKAFREHYLVWWKALLTTPSETTGKRLIDEPAVAGAELVNEDSYFFWTFTPDNVPDVQLRMIEKEFGDWLARKYGSIDSAFTAWGGPREVRDQPSEGRVAFRPLWNIANERKPRDKDTARFLAEHQRAFYQDMTKALRDLGFKGVICASNWFTADPRVLGPLERYSYTPCDFIDRHGYFGCFGKGEAAEWSIRDGHTYADRSALKFDPEEPGKPRSFTHPAMDLGYDGKPSMISETTWNRPNRYRSEAPLYYAVYGALQGTDAIVHFAMDTTTWSVKPGFFMQPWTLMSPAMTGQFPAAALIYRKGLVSPGEVLVDLDLGLPDLFDLKGTPLPQDANFDELRAKDVPNGTTLKPGNVIDPLVHYAGRTNVNFIAKGAGKARLKDVSRLIDRKRQVVTSAGGQLRLDYGKGMLAINAPSAQGLSGSLKDAGKVDLKDLAITSQMDLGHIVAVSLDGKPLASSSRILLQVMSEEKSAGFQAELAGPLKRIASIGHDPWMVREFEGVVRFKRADAKDLKVSALDANGDVAERAGSAAEIKLRPRVLYYLIAR